MSRIHVCPACKALEHGVKSRRAFEHIGCEFDRHTYALRNGQGSATFIGKPDQSMLEAVNNLADLAWEKLKKM